LRNRTKQLAEANGFHLNGHRLSSTDSKVTSSRQAQHSVFSQFNAPGVYFKLGMVDPVFVSISSLFGPTIFQERVIIFLGSCVFCR